MFDGLRNDAEKTSGFDEGQIEFFPDDKPTVAQTRRRSSSKKILGLTAQQRFLLAFMFMLSVCVMGAMLTVFFGKVVL